MTQSSILCQYTFLGGGTRHFALLWQHGVYSVGFFSGGKTVPCLFWWYRHDLVVPPQLFFGITPFPRRKEGHGILPSFWFDPHDWSSRPQVCFLTITLTYLRRGTTFSRLAVPSFCPHYLLTKPHPPARQYSQRQIDRRKVSDSKPLPFRPTSG